jgi:hypothetical protein
MGVAGALAGDGTPELSESLAQCAAGGRQALRTEEQQRDDQNEDQMGGLKNVSEHDVSLGEAGSAPGRGGEPRADPASLR